MRKVMFGMAFMLVSMLSANVFASTHFGHIYFVLSGDSGITRTTPDETQLIYNSSNQLVTTKYFIGPYNDTRDIVFVQASIKRTDPNLPYYHWSVSRRSSADTTWIPVNDTWTYEDGDYLGYTAQHHYENDWVDWEDEFEFIKMNYQGNIGGYMHYAHFGFYS